MAALRPSGWRSGAPSTGVSDSTPDSRGSAPAMMVLSVTLCVWPLRSCHDTTACSDL